MTLTAQPAAPAVTGIELHHYLGTLRHHATSVTVVTAPGPAGFTATTFTSVSLRPQLVSFCIDRDASSGPAIERARHVAVHVLAADQEQLARTFAARGVDRFADTGAWRQGPYGVPLLHGVLATLTCEIVERIPVGDHIVVIGRPVSAEHRPGEPLLYHMGAYTRLAH